MATQSGSKVPVHIFNVYGGDTSSHQLTLTNKTTGEPVNLNGASVLVKIKKKATDATAVLTWTHNDNIEIQGASKNILLFKSFEDVPKGNEFVYDVQVTFANGVIKTLFRGSIITEQDVS
jgi:hypothetical protein